jgi:hypothetical protein
MTITDGNQYNETRLKEIINKEDHPGGTLSGIINQFGYPSFYDYFEKENVLIIYYLSEETETMYVLAPFYITKKIDYHGYYFQFDINGGNILASKLNNTGYKIMLGKHYEYKQQVPLGIFLEELKKGKS